MVPLLDLRRQYATLKDEIEPVVLRVCESQQFILGEEVTAMEEAMASYSGAKHALGVSSGTDALLLAMMGLGLGPGDEVITVPFTFFSTVGTIDRLGIRTVFCDIDPESYNIDVNQVEDAISDKTKAIVPVHLFGQCADMDPLLEIAERHGIPVLEDAAQAIGAQYLRTRGDNAEVKRAGSMGTMGCFSFFPSKNLGAFGDAGLILTNDDALYRQLVALRVHGAYQTYFHEMVGGNFRIDALQAAILRVKLKYLDEWSMKRAENACRYERLFDEAGVGDTLTVPGPSIAARKKQQEHPDLALPYSHIFNQFVVRAPRRDDLKKHLQERQIGCSIYYPLSLHEQPCFRHLGHQTGDFPHSEQAAKEVLALPVFPELRVEEQQQVVDAIAEFYQGA